MLFRFWLNPNNASRPAPRIATLFSIIIVASSCVFSQTDTDPSLPGSSLEIAGQVTSPNGRNAVQFVTVRLERAGGSLVDQRITDSAGKFRFSRLLAGQYVVSAKSPGFTVLPQMVDVSRFAPHIYLILQLAEEKSPFDKHETARPGVINALVPEKARREMDKAREALANKKTEEGVLHLEKALNIFPDFFEAQMLLGTTHMEDGHLDKADEAFHHALRIDPKSVPAMVSLGEVLRRQKRYSNAEQLLLEALKLKEDAWVAHYALARVYWETNEIVKAGRQTGRAIQLQPDFADAHLIGGNVFMRLGMPENALVEYEEYLRLAPHGQQAAQTQELITKLRNAARQKKP